MNVPIMFTAAEDLEKGERQFIFALHDIAELLETKQISFYTFCKHLSKDLKYRDLDLQECLEHLITKNAEGTYFNGK